jgi:hypothetical protein
MPENPVASAVFAAVHWSAAGTELVESLTEAPSRQVDPRTEMDSALFPNVAKTRSEAMSREWYIKHRLARTREKRKNSCAS